MSRSAISRRNILIPRRINARVEGTPYVPAEGSRVAFVASYACDARVTKSLSELILRLRRLDYEVVLIRASENQDPLIWPDSAPKDIVVLRKPNLGYDFGSWAVGLDRYRSLVSRPFVLLANDSLAGPFDELGDVIHEFESDSCDVWGVTRSTQIMPHLQSYFLGFRNGILLERPMRTFWNNLPVETEKHNIVEAYEIALARLLFSEGFVVSALIEPEQLGTGDQNPTLDGWRRLLDLGFPFIKRSVIANAACPLNREKIAATVRATYNTELNDWL